MDRRWHPRLSISPAGPHWVAVTSAASRAANHSAHASDHRIVRQPACLQRPAVMPNRTGKPDNSSSSRVPDRCLPGQAASPFTHSSVPPLRTPPGWPLTDEISRAIDHRKVSAHLYCPLTYLKEQGSRRATTSFQHKVVVIGLIEIGDRTDSRCSRIGQRGQERMALGTS